MKRNYFCQRKTSAFTLIELLLALFVASIVVGCFALIFDFSIRTTEHTSTRENTSSIGLQVLNLITDELSQATEIYPADRFLIHASYRNTMGFVARIPEGDKFKYLFYCLRDQTLYRFALNTAQSDYKKVNFSTILESGENAVADDIISIEGSGLDAVGKLVNIHFSVLDRDNTVSYHTRIFSRAVLDL